MIYNILGILIAIVLIIYQLPIFKKWDIKNKINDIDNDPILNKINKNLNDLNVQAGLRLKNDPKMVQLFKDAGVKIDSLVDESQSIVEKSDNEDRQQTRTELLTSKYGEITAKKIIHKEVWIDMSSDQLIESRRKPNHIEKEITKDSIKETWIYGNKVSGSYFELENGVVVKIVDR